MKYKNLKEIRMAYESGELDASDYVDQIRITDKGLYITRWDEEANDYEQLFSRDGWEETLREALNDLGIPSWDAN